jgi:type IV fimbrial biogenesis protein FimT
MAVRARGFTLIEMLIGLVVAAVLLSLVAASFVDQLARRRLEGAATELSTDFQYARAQAVANGASAALATNASGTQYTITSGATTYKSVALDSRLSITPNVTVTFDQLRAMAAASAAVTLSSTQTSGQLTVSVSPMGRVSMCTPSGLLKGYTSC